MSTEPPTGLQVERFRNIEPALVRAAGSLGVGIMHRYISPDQAAKFCDDIGAIDPWADNRREVAWWNNHHNRLPAWDEMLDDIRKQIDKAGADVSDLFKTNPGTLKLYTPAAGIDWHRDGPIGRKKLHVAISFSNTAAFSWRDETGQEYTEELGPGDLAITRDGIEHQASPPKQPGNRIIGLLFSD